MPPAGERKWVRGKWVKKLHEVAKLSSSQTVLKSRTSMGVNAAKYDPQEKMRFNRLLEFRFWLLSAVECLVIFEMCLFYYNKLVNVLKKIWDESRLPKQYLLIPSSEDFLMLQTKEYSECSDLNLESRIVISVSSKNVKNYIHEVKFKSHHKPKKKKFCFLCRSQSNSLLLILSAYLIIFLIASVILILSVLKLQNFNENEKFDANIKTSENAYTVSYNSIKQIDSVFSRTFFKEFVWPYRRSLFNCSNLSEVEKFTYLTSGWTKNVFSFEHGGKSFALKTVNIEGTDMKKCMEMKSNKVCFDKASSKMYKEYILSKELTHSNIVKVLAWCVSNSNFSNNVAIVTELCSPIDLIVLLRMSFQQRLKIMLDLSQLMAYLANSPLGSVAINDFQRQQFVMCGNNLKLTDLDDLSIEEPRCTHHKHCMQKKLFFDFLDGNKTKNILLQCINNLCVGHNEKQNVINTFKHFVNVFLNITSPVALKKDIDALFNSYTTSWSAKTVLKYTEDLYSSFSAMKNEIYNKSNS